MGKLFQLLNPRGLKNQNGDAFLLSKEEWLAIQVYAKTALALPISEAAMRQMLMLDVKESIEPFQRIIDAYKDIYLHCKEWDDKTFPMSVELASDIVQYSRQASSYYRSLLPWAAKLVIDPDNSEARRMLLSIFTRLATDAGKRAQKAKEVAILVTKFAKETESDQVVIQGNGNGGLVKYYNDTFGASSKEGKELQEQLDKARQLLAEANDEYKHDVIVAATTPTYAMVPFYGWVAAPVVAGIFTKKALDALEAMDRARREIGRLEATIRRNTLLIAEIQRAQGSIQTIQEKMNAALPLIQKIQGTWEAIASDLKNFVTNLDQNLRESILQDPGMIEPDVEAAIDTWTELGKAADKYRTNAYVQVTSRKAA